MSYIYWVVVVVTALLVVTIGASVINTVLFVYDSQDCECGVCKYPTSNNYTSVVNTLSTYEVIQYQNGTIEEYLNGVVKS